MRPARVRSDPPSLADVVHRAGEAVDPEGSNDGVWDLVDRFSDSDQPVTAEGAFVEELIAEIKGAIDPQDEDAQVVLAAAIATYLAYRRTELDRDPAELLRLAVRAEFDGKPPEVAARWLEEQGVGY
jgi:hypothetical protein